MDLLWNILGHTVRITILRIYYIYISLYKSCLRNDTMQKDIIRMTVGSRVLLRTTTAVRSNMTGIAIRSSMVAATASLAGRTPLKWLLLLLLRRRRKFPTNRPPVAMTIKRLGVKTIHPTMGAGMSLRRCPPASCEVVLARWRWHEFFHDGIGGRVFGTTTRIHHGRHAQLVQVGMVDIACIRVGT
jgi:hypothetical protein